MFPAAISFFEFESKPYRVMCRKEGKKHLQRKMVCRRRCQRPDLWISWWQNQGLFHGTTRSPSSREKSDSGSPGNAEVGKDSVRTIIWQQLASTSPYPAEQSQLKNAKEKIFGNKNKRVKAHIRQATGKRSRVSAKLKIGRDSGTVRAQYICRGKSSPVHTEEAGTHGFINQRIGRSEDEHIDLVMVHIIFNESSCSSWTGLVHERVCGRE